MSDFDTWVFDNLFVLRGKRESSFLISEIVSSLWVSFGLSLTDGIFLRNWSNVNCLNFGSFEGDLIGVDGGVSSSSSSSSSSSFVESLVAESRRRDIYSCECSSSWLVTLDSVLLDTRYLT